MNFSGASAFFSLCSLSDSVSDSVSVSDSDSDSGPLDQRRKGV
jgi:hypothetical protein